MHSSPRTRRATLTAAALSAGVGAFGADPGSEAARPWKRPNIVLILADDMGFSDLGCYGSEIRTPNLDRLAAEGVRFTQFYNAARCCPTRASLLTGLYPHQAGMGAMVDSKGEGPYQGYLNRNCVTLAEVLRSAGYRTLLSGKWHVGEAPEHWPAKRGFDRSYGLISGAMNYFDIDQARKPGVIRHFALDGQAHRPPKEGFYATDAFTDHALEFLKEQESRPEPFFLYLAYNAPHWPLHALPEDIERYRGKYRAGWTELRKQRYARQKELGIVDARWPLSPQDPAAPDWDAVEDKDLMDLKMAVYAAQIDRMDQGIGRILAALDASGDRDNTLVLFLSDNGACHEGGPLGFDERKNGVPPGGVDSFMSYGTAWSNASNTPFRKHKHWVHEGGISTPLIVRWPAVIRQTNAITPQPGHIVDVMATLCDVTGAAYPTEVEGQRITPMEGTSLLPIFQGREREAPEVLFWEHFGNRAVRMGRWKLVATAKGPWELYDLEADRTELHDLAGERPELLQDLLARYRTWSERCGVRAP